MNKVNLLKLADYLESLPQNYEHFDMEYFYKDDDPEPSKSYYGFNECGAVACAVGHIPLALGMSNKEVRRDYISWHHLAERTLGYMEGEEFEWMFSSNWTKVDNTPKGAASRIRLFVELGHPPVGFDTDEDFNYSKELY